MELQFLGATETVTGSKYLLSHRDFRLLVDCGLYQGVKNLRLRNWRPMPFRVQDLDAIILTHAHIDHSGYIPALYRQGYRGPVYCSHSTLALCKVLLPDAGFLQEEDARYANRKHFSKHEPARPLYTENDAERSLSLFTPVEFNQVVRIGHFDVQMVPSGHILGACSVHLSNGNQSILFSGDIGRRNDPIMFPPQTPPPANYVVVESTYGDRLHEKVDALGELEEMGAIIRNTIQRGGTVLIPAFAVGRAQLVLHLLQRLRADHAIPNVPIYLNSPMAISATELFCRVEEEHKLTAADCREIDDNTHFVHTAEESIALNEQNYPCIIISASGMASGGRVLHHLKKLLPDHRNSVIFVGFQAPGTRGDTLCRGIDTVKIHGQYVPVSAAIHNLDSLSAHADSDGLMHWLGQLDPPPVQTWVTHGEAAAADHLRLRIKDELGWAAEVPSYLEKVTLD